LRVDNRDLFAMPPPERFRDTGQHLTDFLDELLVECPRCQARAVVRQFGGGKPHWFAPRRLVCAGCAYVKEMNGKRVGGAPGQDWYFQQPLWLRAHCCGELLWAFNARHLSYLEAYIRADLREKQRPHPGHWNHHSLVTRMPLWMKQAQNREPLLRALARLAERAA
jgi:hypothetical protein